MSQFTGTPIFDADQHMYEAPEALTKFLPEQYQSNVQFVQIGKRTRIANRGQINDFMPNPTFERVAADTRHTYDFMGDNARRFMGLPLRNPHPDAAKLPLRESAGASA